MATKPDRGTPEPTPAAEALHDQQEWLRVTLSSIGDAVITTDTDGRVTFLNPVAQSVTGWTQQDAAGKPLDIVFQIVNEETRCTVENPATRALRAGVVVGLANHTLLIGRDGTERPIDDSAAPIRNAKGEVAGVVLVFRDVTERRRAEEALRQSERRFRLLVEAVQDYAIFLLDPKGNVVSWNTGAERIKNYRAEEIVGKHFSCFYPPEAVNAGWPEIELQMAATESRFQNEGWRLRKDGSRFWANVVITALRDESGNLKGFSKVTQDLTERRRADEKLRDSELSYRRLFEAARDGVLLLDAGTGKITDSNPFMTELLSYTKDELLGKELWQIGLFQDINANRAAFRELQERGYIRYDNLPLKQKSGHEFEVEFVSNLYQVDSKLVIQCNIRDISEHSQLERTRVQTEALADLNRRKDEFLAMLSHELRNPLAPILNAVQLLGLQQGNENPIQQQARTIIERQVGQLKHLVDDLLEVSRISTGRIRLHQENVDMRGIVEHALETVRPLLDQRQHKLTVSKPAEPVWLHADSTRLEQVVVNLLTNAAKYTDDGGHVWLTAEQVGDEMVLRVRDTGVGVAPDLLPRIFDLFAQAERSLDRSQGGLGVGLTVVQKLVEMHRGKVEAYSVLGQGSEFVVRLPVLQLPEPQPRPPFTETTLPPGKCCRVLVVDDNADQAESLAMLMRAERHDVRTAHDGPTALDAALDYRPDVVLLDIGLPGLNGYDVARQMRRQPGLKSVVLVAMTGYGQDVDRQRSQEAGFDHHLVKPADLDALRQLLARPR